MRIGAAARRSTWLLALALVCPPAGNPAAASGPAPLHLRSGLARSIATMPGGPEFLDGVRELQRRDVCQCDMVQPIHDVDDDGVDDLVYSTYTYEPPTTTFSLLSGRTGKALSPAPVEVLGLGYATEAHLGERGRGFIYLSSDWDATRPALVAGAVDATGSKVWERPWQEASGWVPGVGVAAAEFEAVEIFQENGRTDLVVATSASFHSEDRASVVLLERVSGADGSTVARDSWDVAGVDEVALDAVAGVSAPGETDLLIQTKVFDQRAATMELRPDVDADPAWSIEIVTPWELFEIDVADVTGDAASEILLQRYQQRRVLALGGATGEAIWSAEGLYDSTISGSRGDELLFGDERVSDGRVDYTLTRSDPRSGRLWSASFRISALTRYTAEGDGYAWPVGDATGDGVADVGVQMFLWDYDGDHTWLRASRQFLLDGSTGRRLAAGVGYFPLSGSFSDDGSDAVDFRRVDGRVVMRARDGGSGRVLWRTRLGAVRDWPPCDWGKRSLRTEEGPDHLLLQVPTKEGDDELVFDGATGALLYRI